MPKLDNGTPRTNEAEKKKSPPTQLLYIKTADESISEMNLSGRKFYHDGTSTVNQASAPLGPAEVHEIIFNSPDPLKPRTKPIATPPEPHKSVKVKKNIAGKRTMSRKTTKPSDKIEAKNIDGTGIKKLSTSVHPTMSKILTLQKVTDELEEIVNTFSKEVPDMSKVPYLQFHHKQFFKVSSVDPYSVSENTEEQAFEKNKDIVTTTPKNVLQALENEVHDAIKEKKIFTVCGSLDHPVRKALLLRGWVEKFHKSYETQLDGDMSLVFKSGIEELLDLAKDQHYTDSCKLFIKSKLLESQPIYFFWGTGRAETLRENPTASPTIINKLPKDMFTGPETGKINSPRVYPLGGKSGQLQNFIRDFRQVAAMSVLKWIVKTKIKSESRVVSPSGRIPLEVFEFAANECCKFIKESRNEPDIPPATDFEWGEFLKYFYELIHQCNHFKEDGTESEETLFTKANCIMKNLKYYYPWFDVDGIMNIWILKAADKTPKKDIRVYKTLEQILHDVNKSAKTTYLVQKYIEKPLLIHKIKFDVKFWFLISSCFPLTAWIHRECYLQFGSETYNVRKASDTFSRKTPSPQHVLQTLRDHETFPISDIWRHEEFQNYLANIGYPESFNQIIFPEVKRSLMHVVNKYKDKITIRRKSFELGVANFLLTNDFKPWLLKISSTDKYDNVQEISGVYGEICEDVIKVVVDYAFNDEADTGGFELLYKQELVKSLPPLPTKKSSKSLIRKTKPNNPEHKESFQKFGERIKATLKTLLQIIQTEKEKKQSKH